MSPHLPPETAVDRILRGSREASAKWTQVEGEEKVRFEKAKHVDELWESILDGFPCRIIDPETDPRCSFSEYREYSLDELCLHFAGKLVELGKLLSNEGLADRIRSDQSNDDAKLFAQGILRCGIDGDENGAFRLLRESYNLRGDLGACAREWVSDGFKREILDIKPPQNYEEVNTLADFIEWLNTEIAVRIAVPMGHQLDIDDSRIIQFAYKKLVRLGLRKEFGDEPTAALTIDGVNAFLRNLQNEAELLLQRQVIADASNTDAKLAHENSRSPHAVTATVEHFDGISTGIKSPTAERNVERVNKLQKAVRLAYLSFNCIQDHCDRQLEDREAYEILQEQGFPNDPGDIGELDGYEPPSFETWSRYLRNGRKAFGQQKYEKRSERPHGKSIVRRDQI